MKDILKPQLILLTLCLIFGIIGCDNKKSPLKSIDKIANQKKTIPKSIVPQKYNKTVNTGKTKPLAVINQSKSVDYNKINKKYRRDSGKLDFNLMTTEELKNYASELLENGTYDEILHFINLSRDRLSYDYTFKDLAIALYSNLIANASSKKEKISHNCAIGNLLYYYYAKQLISAPPKEARQYFEAVFDNIAVSKYESPFLATCKYMVLANLADLYIRENLPIEDSFKLLKNARQTYEKNIDIIPDADKMMIDMADEEFFRHIANYIRRHPDEKYSNDIVKQIKAGILRQESTPNQDLLYSKNLKLLREFIKNKEE
jgi:hypothetical protein